MNCTGKKQVSTHDLFPIVREALENGKKVKFTVSGTSMLPWIADNRDQVLLTRKDPKHLKPGEIILFCHGHSYLLHRIYKKTGNGYCTIGDSCLYKDEPVDPEEIIGVVEAIYRKGKVINCNSFLWKPVFTLWRWLLPIRGQLLSLYYSLAKLKSKLVTQIRSFE